MKRNRGLFSVGDQEKEKIKNNLELWASKNNHLRNASFFDVCVGYVYGMLTDEMKRGMFIMFKGTEEEKVPFFNLIFGKLINEGITEAVFNLYSENSWHLTRAVFNNDTFYVDVPGGDITISNFCFTQHRYARTFGDSDRTKLVVPCGGGKFVITGWNEMVHGLRKIKEIKEKVDSNKEHYERIGITQESLKIYLTVTRTTVDWGTVDLKQLVSDLTFHNPFEHKNLSLDYIF